MGEGVTDDEYTHTFTVHSHGHELFDTQNRAQPHTSLAVANDELALATANGDERVDGLEAGLHRLADRLPRDDTRRLDLCACVQAVG